MCVMSDVLYIPDEETTAVPSMYVDEKIGKICLS